MAQQIEQVMTRRIQTVPRTASLRQVARVMDEQKIGNVIVLDADGAMCGILTDRDLVVRGVAAQRDLDTTQVGDVCSDVSVKLPPTASVDDAVKLMRERAVRRIPVVRDGKALGIVTIGDLARAIDPKSALAQISAAPPNN